LNEKWKIVSGNNIWNKMWLERILKIKKVLETPWETDENNIESTLQKNCENDIKKHPEIPLKTQWKYPGINY